MSHDANVGDTDWYGRTRCVRFFRASVSKLRFLSSVGGRVLSAAVRVALPAKSLYFFLNLWTLLPCFVLAQRERRACFVLAPCLSNVLLLAQKVPSDTPILSRLPIFFSFVLLSFVLK